MSAIASAPALPRTTAAMAVACPTDVHGRLQVGAAICDESGWLDIGSYVDLKSCFPSDLEASPRSSPRPPGTLPDDWAAQDLRHLRATCDARGKYWNVECKGVPHVRKCRAFSAVKLGSWRLAFLMARLQRDVWLQVSARMESLPRPPTGSSSDVRHGKRGANVQKGLKRALPETTLTAGTDNSCSAVGFRKKIRGKTRTATSAVFGEWFPLFSNWFALGPGETEALNPSPFDLAALACVSPMFRHLRGEEKACPPPQVALRRLRGKTPRSQFFYGRHIPPSPMSVARRILAGSQRCQHGLDHAVRRGDLDAMRFHVQVRGARLRDALRCAVVHSQPGLVQYILGQGINVNEVSGGGRPSVLDAALAAWARRHGFGDAASRITCADGGRAMEVIGLLAANGVNLNVALAPRSLPFLQQDDGPLAWALRAHAQIFAGRVGQNGRASPLCSLVRCLVSHGADHTALTRRQRRSLDNML